MFLTPKTFTNMNNNEEVIPLRGKGATCKKNSWPQPASPFDFLTN